MHSWPEEQDGALPHRHAPATEQLSARASSQTRHVLPLSPQEWKPSKEHWLFTQHPPSQDSWSQTHRPLEQRWPVAQAGVHSSVDVALLEPPPLDVEDAAASTPLPGVNRNTQVPLASPWGWPRSQVLRSWSQSWLLLQGMERVGQAVAKTTHNNAGRHGRLDTASPGLDLQHVMHTPGCGHRKVQHPRKVPRDAVSIPISFRHAM